MEARHESTLLSRATLLSTRRSLAPAQSAAASSNDAEYDDDISGAAVALDSFLSTAFRAGLVTRSINKLTFMSEVSSIGEGADYRVELLRQGGQRPLVVKHVKAMIPVIKPGGVITVAAAPRVAKALREMLIAQHPPLRDAPNILNLEAYGWDYVDTGTITPCLIAEYAEKGNMRQYLVANSKQPPGGRHLLWKGVAEGLLALHSCDIVHGDVKLDNVLIAVDPTTGEAVPKIADFGSSLFTHPRVTDQQYLGTTIYNAPEISFSANGFGVKQLPFEGLKLCDIYSFGLLVWETVKDGALYVSAETFNAEAEGPARDWRATAIEELQELTFMSENDAQQIATALTSTLSPISSERKSIQSVLESVGHNTARRCILFWTSIPSRNQEDALHYLAFHGPAENLAKLIEAGAEDHQDKYGQTALLLACRRGCLEHARLLLSNGSDPSIADNEGRTPLHMLVMFPASEVAETGSLLLSSGKADINACLPVHNIEQAPDFWAYLNGDPLEWAVTCGNRPAVKFLISRKADVLRGLLAAVSLHLDDIVGLILQAPRYSANKDLLLSCFRQLNQSHPFRRMLMHGKDFDTALLRTVEVLRRAWNKCMFTPKQMPSTDKSRVKLQDLNDSSSEAEHSTESDIPFGVDEIGLGPVTSVAMDNISFQDADIVRSLLSLTRMRSGKTANEAIKCALLGCHYSPFESNNRIAIALIEAGFPLEVLDEEGMSPIHLAVGIANSFVVKAIIQKKNSLVNLRDLDGASLLHHAVMSTNPSSITKTLLELGADPTLAPTSGVCETPLGLYIRQGKLYSAQSVLPLLMAHGQDNRYTAVPGDESWRNALQYAAWFASHYESRGPRATGMLKAVLQQEQVRALIDTPANDGFNALHSVCYNGHLPSARMLLNAGADPLLRTQTGLDCLHVALLGTHGVMTGAHIPYAERLPQAYDLCLYLAKALEGTPRDVRYTPLHIAVVIGYVEVVYRILSEDLPLVLALDGRGYKPSRLLASILDSQQVGMSTYLARCDPEFRSRALFLDKFLFRLEIQASGGLLKADSDDESDNDTYWALGESQTEAVGGNAPRGDEAGSEEGAQFVRFKVPKDPGSDGYRIFERFVKENFPLYRMSTAQQSE